MIGVGDGDEKTKNLMDEDLSSYDEDDGSNDGDDGGEAGYDGCKVAKHS